MCMYIYIYMNHVNIVCISIYLINSNHTCVDICKFYKCTFVHCALCHQAESGSVVHPAAGAPGAPGL